MEQTLNTEAPVKRPDFLNVLCILSFICCGLMILMGIWGVMQSMTVPSADEIQMQEMMARMNPDADMSALTQRDPTGQVIGLLFQVLSLVGVIMMWKLKKVGFYIYTAAELLPYPATFLTSGAKSATAIVGALGQTFESIVYVVIALVVIIDLVFIFLYSRNLKAMS